MKTSKTLLLLLVLSLAFFSCEKTEVTPDVQLPAITKWAGTYTTATQWWGTYYSPMVITDEGKLFIAEHEIEFEFDEVTNQLSFGWHDIKAQRAKGSITFSEKVDGRLQFSGSINPRAQDGPVSYSGNAD